MFSFSWKARSCDGLGLCAGLGLGDGCPSELCLLCPHHPSRCPHPEAKCQLPFINKFAQLVFLFGDLRRKECISQSSSSYKLANKTHIEREKVGEKLFLEEVETIPTRLICKQGVSASRESTATPWETGPSGLPHPGLDPAGGTRGRCYHLGKTGQ